MTKLLLSFLLAAGAAVPGHTQQPEPASADAQSGTIVVQGQRTSGKTIDNFVRDLTPAPFGGQLGRFEDPVCPVVLGMPAREGQLVQDRLRQVAGAVGMKTAPAKCVPNLYVLIGRNKKEVIEGLDRKFPALLTGLSRREIGAMKEVPGPAVSWQILDRIGADGMPLAVARMGADAEPVRIVRGVGAISRISALTKVKFVASLIMFEAPALDGVTTRQLADYTAMRTFAATDPARGGRLPATSILELFRPGAEPADAPPSVTWWDYAFLKSLYASSTELTATAQRREMKHIVAKELSKVPPEEQ